MEIQLLMRLRQLKRMVRRRQFHVECCLLLVQRKLVLDWPTLPYVEELTLLTLTVQLKL